MDMAGYDVTRMALELDVIVGKLAQLDVVDAGILLVGRHTQAQAGDQVHQEQDDARQDERIGEAGNGVGELVGELDVVVVDPATGDDGETIESCYVVTTEEGVSQGGFGSSMV
jgi:hypothetical protein